MQRFWQPSADIVFPRITRLAAVFAAIALLTISLIAQESPASGSASAQVSKAVGTIKSIQADSITVAAESGGDITATLTPTTKILRVPPGEKDLKNATALQAQDLQPGDRVLVRGQAAASGDAHTVTAIAVIVMKQADVAAVHQRELDDWQKRGVGGLVTNVDAGTGTITISSGGLLAKRNIAIHTTKDTVLRRYTAGSVKFDDAKPAPIDQIKAGDQLLARGTRNADGSEIAAEAVVSGTFRSIAGTIKTVDVASNSMTVQDVIGKSAVVVKVSPDSQMWKLPLDMAQRFAARLKGTGGASGSGGEQPGAGASAQSGGGGQHSTAAPSHPGAESQAGRGGGGNGPPDLQRILSRLPPMKLADLQKGDVVYILATEGGSSDIVASKLVAGVEPILTANPNRSASTLLSPWSLSTSGGEGEGSQ
jgi:hypothetical protein